MPTQNDSGQKNAPLGAYGNFVIILLTLFQFTVMVDFMVISPLGPFVMTDLNMSPGQFGIVVSCYALSAALSGLFFASIADRFNRKRLLVAVYCGFLLGTVACALAPSYGLFVGARCVTGLFGGVIGAIIISIITDIIPLRSRGFAMGTLSTANSAAMVLGIPIGLLLANRFNWHGPFFAIGLFGLAILGAAMVFLEPIARRIDRDKPARKLLKTISTSRYVVGFCAIALITLGAYMLQPFSAAFVVYNLAVPLNTLPIVFFASGVVALIAGPLLGRIADKVGKYHVFLVASLASTAVVIWFTNLGNAPLWMVIALNCLLSIANTGRMSATMALISTVPKPEDRGGL